MARVVIVLDTSWILPDGRVAGRTEDGRTVRFSGALPGDRVLLSPTSTHGRTIDAELVEILEPSPDRVVAPCVHSAICGGCDLDGLSREARARALTLMVGRAFRHEEIEFVPSPRPTGHRARIKLLVREGRLGYSAPRSHTFVPIEACPIARPEVDAARARLSSWLAEDPRRAEGLAEVELRSDGQRVVYAFRSEGHPDRRALAELGDVALDDKALSGNPTLTLTVGGVALRASPASFYQVNLEIDALMVARVTDTMLSRKVERVLDLYAGIGNFGLPLAQRGVPVVEVEVPGPGSEDLRFNAKQVGRAEVIAARVERFDPSRTAFDAVILDPPRAGAPGVLAKVSRNRPRVIAYVSCFAPNAARDLGELRGYHIVSVTAFDMFPDTHHVETVVILERS
jgi:23S rRNA (uracil1939-C5)-methyltransferase